MPFFIISLINPPHKTKIHIIIVSAYGVNEYMSEKEAL